MSSYQILSQELQCPICKGLLKDPKFVGQCLHTACLGCLEKLVAAKRSSSFQCPDCRQKCKVPPKGVTELKDDFRLHAMAEKFEKMMDDKTIIICTACDNPAFHYCEECDKIYLCKPCSEQHSQDPLTATHDLVGICSPHGKKLALYCKKCRTAICSACLIADHPSGPKRHDVVPHQEVASNEAAEVVAAVEKLDKVRERKQDALFNIITFRESIVKTINSDLADLGEQSDSAIEHVRMKQADLMTENHSLENQIGKLKEQIEIMVKRKTAVVNEILQTSEKETLLLQQKEEYSEYLNQYRDACTNKFKDVVIQAVAEIDEIKAKVDQGNKVTSSKPLLDHQTVPRLQQVKEGLTKATTAPNVDKVAPFVDVKERMVKFIPNRAPMEIGFLLRWFTSLAKLGDVSYPSDGPCEYIWSVTYLPDGRLASLYTPFYGARANMISLHGPSLLADPQMTIEKNIHPAVDMTATSKGELMVLRTAEPIVRVFDSHSGDFRDISVCVRKKQIGDLKSIETNDEGNIFLADTNGHLYISNSDGVIIKEVQASSQNCSRMSYCWVTRTIHIANREHILRYHFDGTTLNEMPSFDHGVDGFNCSDVCIGKGTEMFVAGSMNGTKEIRIYQVIEMDKPIQQKDMVRLSFSDNTNRNSTIGDPVISIFGNTLALGYHRKLELLLLNN